MSEPGGTDHDQRLKVLLKEFFEAFFICFFPAWAARFEFLAIDWLERFTFRWHTIWMEILGRR